MWEQKITPEEYPDYQMNLIREGYHGFTKKTPDKSLFLQTWYKKGQDGPKVIGTNTGRKIISAFEPGEQLKHPSTGNNINKNEFK